MQEDMQEPTFSRAHREHIVEADQQILHESRTQWSMCVIGFLVDERNFSPKRMQVVLRRARHLWNEFQVIGK